MKKLVFLLVLAVSATCFGQNDEAYVDGLVTEFTMKLAERNITNYFVAKRYCSGKIEMFQIGKEKKLCTSRGTYYMVYVVWTEDDKFHLKKMDNCGLFYTTELSDGELYNFYAANKEPLRNEIVRNYKSASYTGTPELRKNPQPCFRNFVFSENGQTTKQTYNLYELKEANGDNLNYEYNSQLKIVQLDALLDAALATSEATMRRQI